MGTLTGRRARTHANLVETLRAIVLGLSPAGIPAARRAALVRRGWITEACGTITRAGSRVLRAQGEQAQRDLMEWLKSDQAKELFRT